MELFTMKYRTVFLSCIYFIGCINDVVSPAKTYRTIAPPKRTLATIFKPQVASKVCLLKPDEGPCRGSISMYYFDPKTKKCENFLWGGCQGNGNRFDKKSECISTCLTSPYAPKVKPRYCSLNFDYGFCFGAVKRYYYDRMWRVCKETLYSGCGGNKNNFYSFDQCDSICRLAKGSLTERKKSSTDKVRRVVYVYTNVTKKPTRKKTIRTRPMLILH